jgi:hypothetical protein
MNGSGEAVCGSFLPLDAPAAAFPSCPLEVEAALPVLVEGLAWFC